MITNDEFTFLLQLEEKFAQAYRSGFLRGGDLQEFKQVVNIYNKIVGGTFYTATCASCRLELYARMYGVLQNLKQQKSPSAKPPAEDNNREAAQPKTKAKPNQNQNHKK